MLVQQPAAAEKTKEKTTTSTPQKPASTAHPDIGTVLAAMPRDSDAATLTAPAPAAKAKAKSGGAKAPAPARAAPRRAAATISAPAPSPTLTSPSGQPLCPSTPAATYQCVPYGFSPESAPSLKACVDLCAGPPIPGLSDAPTCVNCGDPAAACKKAHGEYGNTFTYTLVSREKEPCYVPPPPPKEGDANCIPNEGENNRGCGNVGSNNVGSNNRGNGNTGSGNVGSFNQVSLGEKKVLKLSPPPTHSAHALTPNPLTHRETKTLGRTTGKHCIGFKVVLESGGG